MKHQMTTQEIVKNSSETKKLGEDWKKVYLFLHKCVESNKYRIMRSGNTLFLYRIDQPKVAQMFVINADSYKNLCRNMQKFITAMKTANFKNVYGITEDINMLNVIKKVGFSVDIEPAGKDKNGKQLYFGSVNFEGTPNV